MNKHHNEAREDRDAGLVSVVIPCYNQAHFLAEAIESVLAQSHRNFEVVVVDDGSTDDTSEVAHRYEEVRLIRQKNRGLAGARNRGLAEAQGEYVVFLDSDDRLLPEALEVGVRELEAHPGCAFVSGHYRPITADGDPYAIPRQTRIDGDHYLALMRDNYISMPASVMYRRWVFGEVGGFDGTVDAAADWDLYLRIARRFPIYHHGRVVADYRWHGANMTNDPALMLRSTVSVLRSQRRYVKGNKRYEGAYNEGIRLFREHNGMNLAKEVRSRVRGRNTWRALRGALVLARYYPRGLSFLFGDGRLRRYEMAEELRARQKRLKNRKRKLRVANRRLKKLGGVLAKERRRGKRLGRRNRDLALEVHGLERQLEHPEVSGTSGRRTPFFVVGEMEPGTSCFRCVLDRHPEVLCGGGGCFFGRDKETEDVPAIFEPTPSLRNSLLGCDEELRLWRSSVWNSWGKQGDAQEDLRNLTRLAVDHYMMQGSARSGKRIVGDQSPLHTDYVDEIFELYPEAKVIHVVRDGRDVALSLMNHLWNLSKDKHEGGIYVLEPEELAKRDAYREAPETFLASGESIFLEERLRQMAVRWNRRTSKASREGPELFGDSFIQLRYEDLLLRPEECMTSVCELLGAQADQDTVGRCVQNNSFEMASGGRAKEFAEGESFFREGVAGDWRNLFTQRDREVYAQIACQTLTEMGYSLE